MPRNIWAGKLKISGIEIGIKLAPVASEPASVTCFACPEHEAGVEMFYRCKGSEEFRRPSEIVRGIKYGEKVILFTKEELDVLKADQNETLQITETRSVYGFDPAYLESPYAVEVDQVDEPAYAAFCRALDRGRKIAIGKLVIQGRTKTVALVANGSLKALTVFVLRKEVHSSKPVQAHATKNNVRVMMKLLDGITTDPKSPIVFDNSYERDLQEMIDAKVSDRMAEALA